MHSPQNTLQLRALRGLLDDILDFIIRCTLLNATDKVDNRDIGGRDSEGHASKLAIEGRNDLAYSLQNVRSWHTAIICTTHLSSTGRRRDNVSSSTSTTSPVLCNI